VGENRAVATTRLIRDVIQPPGDDGAAGRHALAPPAWLRATGQTAWLLIGAVVVLAGVFFALAQAQTIVGPLVAGGIVATVAAPLVSRMERHRLGRGWGALIVLVGLIAVAVLVLFAVLKGISGQADAIAADAAAAAGRLRGWAEDVGLASAQSQSVEDGLKKAAPALLQGLAGGLVAGVRGAAAIALGVSFTAFSIFFLLKDGPRLRGVVERNLGVPLPVGQVVVGRLVTSVRGYFLGTTIVAAFNGVVTALGAWILGVPLPGTIGVVTFVLAYVPFVGAFVAGAFAVVLALGANGTATAVGMLVVCLLANGLLQNLVSPFAMGAALDMNPLLNLAVTVGAGCLFGMFGLILAAPLTSAALHLRSDLRGAGAGDGAVAPPPATG
jgi:predicted PurR-regulated permease PerM